MSLPLLDVLADKFTVGDGCWLWSASTDRQGYGKLRVNGRTALAHRTVYELLVGPIPAGLVTDHLCRVPACVRPSHIEPVTRRENTLRGDGPSARHARQTHCKWGHLFDEANTLLLPDGERQCRACDRERHRGRP